MAVIDANTWQALNPGRSLASTELPALQAACAAVSDALTGMCYPTILEPIALTLQPFPAPTDDKLFLPSPIRSITALHLVPGANGNSALCDSTNLLTQFTDYYYETDAISGWGRTGIVYLTRSSVWGVRYRYPLRHLAPVADPDRGSVFVSGLFGPTTVSDAVRQAASIAATLLFDTRDYGALPQSNSWNGYSESLPAPVTAEAALHSPNVLALLRNARVLRTHVG